MNRQPGPKVVAEDDAHVHSAEGIGLDHHLPRAECLGYVARLIGVSPPHDDPGGIRHRIRVAQKHHVQSLAAEHPGCRAGGALPAAPVQHLDLYSAGGQGHRKCTRGPRLGSGPEETECQREDHDGRNEGELAPVATRLFQNRTVGSRTGHPDRIM
jgi:hypothetical protein